MRCSVAPALGLSLLGAACSVFPAAERPPSVVRDLQAQFRFAPGALRAIEVPASSADLTVWHLHVEPAPVAERFERGHRILLLPAECSAASVRCRVQHWPSEAAAGSGRALFPDAYALFPDVYALRSEPVRQD